MSNVQNIQSIAPMAPAAKKEEVKPKSPVEQEYDDGKNFLEKGEYAQAALAFQNVFLAHEEVEDEAGMANASNQLGHVCLAKEDYKQALVNYQKAWDICDKLFDPMSLQALQKQFVEVYRGLKDFDKAISVSMDLLEIYHENRDPHGTVAVFEDIASIYIEAGDSLKAADTYRTIASIHSNYNHKKIAAGFIQKAEELEQEAK